MVELSGCSELLWVGYEHADLQDQLLGMLRLLCAIREVEAGEELGDGGSRSKAKLSMVVEREEGFRKGEADTGHGNEEQQAG